MSEQLFANKPAIPRCGCGSTAIIGSDLPDFALVRLNEKEQVISGMLPIKVGMCQDCGAITLFASWVVLSHP